ncbi:MAG: class I SAM-dependent methyltransferase [Phycisphaeraceae bacterium]|nr:class I SAM-dependent methyltransferase [Phycisphaeraceae bacterium]
MTPNQEDQPRRRPGASKPGQGPPTAGQPSSRTGGVRPAARKPPPRHHAPGKTQEPGNTRRPERTDWNPVADWYDELVADEGSDYQKNVVFPNSLAMLPAAGNQRVLDLACGQGAWCRILHERGYSVTGIDAAPALLHRAKQRSDPAIHYIKGDIRSLDELGEPQALFDIATCLLAIQNVDPIEPIFTGLGRLLRPGACVLLVMMHPGFRGPRFASWGWDDRHHTQYRRVERYLSNRRHPIQMHPGARPGVVTWTYHRPLGEYVRCLSAGGYVIDALEEWPGHRVSTSGPRAPAENLARREIPLFLALRGVYLPDRPMPGTSSV